MITLAEAREVALRFLAQSRHGLVLLDDQTQEHRFGWVFFPVPAKFAETRDPDFLVPGIGPFIVDRHGECVTLATDRAPEVKIEEFAKDWDRRNTRH